MYKDKAWLKEPTVVNSLVKDALKVLEEIEVEWELDHSAQELRERYYLLWHYLGYLIRTYHLVSLRSLSDVLIKKRRQTYGQ